jgi:hypothetical protein
LIEGVLEGFGLHFGYKCADQALVDVGEHCFAMQRKTRSR